MSDKITLTEHEKMRLKNAYPYLQKGDWNEAFALISNRDGENIISNSPLNILSFLKQNGINLWHNVTVICLEAFWKCSELKSITIPNGVTEIENRAFNECTELQEVIIPDSVTEIWWAIFRNCRKLVEIKYSGTSKQWNAIHKQGGWDEDSSIKTIKCSDDDIQL